MALKNPYGKVELFSGSTWIPVCDTNWDDVDAQVTCRSMGYVNGSALCCNQLGSPFVSSYTAARDMTCTGRELSLLNCSFTTGYCPSRGSAICYNSSIDSVNMTFSVRLFNDSTNWGLVEVRHRGVWGFVCEDSNWTDAAARVVCKELGFSGGGVRFGGPETNQLYGSAWVNGMNCTGNETSLEQCVVEPWGQTGNCQRLARVLCSSTSVPEVRLAGGGSSYGRVEILMDGQTYSVCDNGWEENDATAVCKQLRYQFGLPTKRSYYGAGTGQVALDRVACRTSDTSLLACRSSGWLETEAACGDHSKDAGVICFGEVRLMSGDHSTGIVRINIRTNTYVACGSSFGDTEANVVCRELGFEHGRALPRGAFGRFYNYNRGIHISCLGNETRISSCASFQDYCGSDSSYNYASVHCFNGSFSSVRQGLLGNSSGRLVVSQGGVRGRVCPEGWDDVDAGVVCRQLRYRGGVALAFSDAGTGPYLLSNVACTGVETSISNCVSNGPCSVTYRSPPDVGAVCFSDNSIVVQLVGGRSDKEGLVQVVYGSQVGTVCVPDTYNRDNAARVVCRQLGYVDGEFATFPGGEGTVSISDVICSGYETSVFMCRSGGLFVPPSDRCANHDFDLGVRCSDGVRLFYTIHNTNNSITGVVQINRGSGWINICNDFFDDLDAQVVCLSQGYPYSRVLPKGSMAYLYGNNLITALNCNGTEASLLDCPEQQNITCPWGNSDRYVTVFCSETPSERGLQTAPTSVGGPVVVMADGVKSYVCRDNWDDAAASVYCKDLGYQYGVAIYQTSVSIPRGVAAYLVNSVHCTGSENSLSECSFSSNWSTCVTGYSSAAQSLCYNYTSGYTVQIDTASRGTYGRVKVQHMGYWGFVCPSGFDHNDANVICREVGYTGGWAVVDKSYDRSSLRWLSNIDCDGSESHLTRCRNLVFGNVSNCNTYGLAAVYCNREAVRLAGPEGYYGMVEVNRYGLWGPVCNSNWDDRDANATCRDLGYNNGYHLCCSPFGKYSRPIAENFQCTGREQALTNCSHSPPESLNYCTRDVVSVACYNGPNPTDYTFSLDGGNANNSGEVQVTFMNITGSICSDNWDDTDARVFCRELGFLTGQAFKHHVSNRPFWMTDVQCTGSERSLRDCPKTLAAVSQCSTQLSAGVTCSDIEGYRFDFQDNTKTSGQVVVTHLGVAGRICNTFWDDVDARVQCRSRGYQDGAAYHHSQSNDLYRLPSERGPYWISDVNCTGSEASLGDCPFNDRLHLGNCSMADLAGAVCFNDTGMLLDSSHGIQYRLVSGDRQGAGRVEISEGGLWGTVCDTDWGDEDARVLCRSLNYADGYAVSNAYYGQGAGPIWLSNVRCKGSERSLAECPHSGFNDEVVDSRWSYGCRSHSNDASAVCIDKTLTVRLAGPGGYYGMVEVNRYGLWGPVCNNSWDDRDANATCRGLGYSHGVTFYGNNYASRNSATLNWTSFLETPILVGDFQCSGQESSLAGCSFKDSSDDIGCSERRVAAGVLCSRTSDIQLRLSDGGRNYGRLEVMYEGQWGRVIGSYNFSGINADVACRHLGFVGGQTAPEYMRRDTVTGQVWMSGIYCKGYEQSLFECSNSWNSSSGGGRDVYVICYNTTRISSGNSLSMGVVQIYYNKRWGAICDGGWSEKNTAVTCRHLGYDNGYHLCCSPFGKYSTPIAENFKCTGREQALTNCSHTPSESLNYCTRDVVSVACYKGPAPTDYTFSLDGRNRNNSGEVQVTFMNITGSICSDNWDDADARVFCKELGFLTGQAFKHHVSNRPFWMTDVQCTGSERFLRDCPKTLAAVSQCSTQLSAGVTCSDIEGNNYRLAGSSSSYKGRVEVQVNGTWGTVCGFGYGTSWAKVVCRMHGFTEGSIDYLGSYSDPPNMRYQNTFMCKGDEAVLDECPHTGWKTADNSYSCMSFPASVVCYGDGKLGQEYVRNARQGLVQFYKNGTWYNLCDTSFDDITARFDFQDNTKTRGQVVVTHLGVAGRICNTFWDDLDARVLCRSRGHHDGAAYHYSQYNNLFLLPSERGPYWISDINCTGSEASLGDCPFNDRLHLGNCSMADLAGAVCFNDTAGIQYRLVSGDRLGAGRVEISVGGLWGTVCDTDWDDEDARVLCRTLNYTDGYAVGDAYYGQGAGPNWLSNVRCKGSERSLAECPHSGFNDEVVDRRWNYGCRGHSNDASAVCVDKLKIAGFNPSVGAVMVYLGDAWTLICDEDFDTNSAVTACRSLGFPHGLHVRGGVFGRVDAPIGITHLRCTGREPSILDCTYNVTTSCSSRSYASVVCSREPFIETSKSSAKVRVMEDTVGEPYHGLIDVQVEGVWGAVCAAGFGVTEATVVCKELGFAGGVPYTAHFSDRNRKPILMSDVKCRGDENISDQLSAHNDLHNLLVRLLRPSRRRPVLQRHQFEDPSDDKFWFNQLNCQVITNLRLAGSTTNSSGRVEVFLQGPDQWGTVCDNNWDDFDATVVCNQLGYATGKAVKKRRDLGRQRGLHGDGEAATGLCSLGYGNNYCRHSNDAGVICSGE
ncbi:hypothetical protein C0Q70_00382 [Pomacea canaliculata]|uniref:SRCR domain-containing protein n=1 Tax=Pomacea canaliculata TaxID=400727 RepID=A0A2T7PWH8_POMCA|nr:hypothetical protein C0Q70_00382 [Pomacea canaliculata]